MNSFFRNVGASVILGLAALALAPVPAVAQTAPSPDVVFNWSYRPGSTTSIVFEEMFRCSGASCTEVDLSPFQITSGPAGPDPTAMTVHVCENISPIRQHCEVYRCYQNHEEGYSECHFDFAYGKNCLYQDC